MPGVRLLAAISAGGVLGALARYGLQSVFPNGASAVGWTTLAVNVTGCLLMATAGDDFAADGLVGDGPAADSLIGDGLAEKGACSVP